MWMRSQVAGRPQVARRLVGKGHRCGTRPFERGARVIRQGGFAAQPGHDGVAAPALQVHGRFEAIAAVVAGPAGHPHGARVGPDRQRQLRHREPSALH